MSLRKVLNINGFTVSIQASQNHYCSPKENGLPLLEYSSVEVELSDCYGISVSPSTVNMASWEFDYYFSDGVSGWMPVNEVCRMLLSFIAFE